MYTDKCAWLANAHIFHWQKNILMSSDDNFYAKETYMELLSEVLATGVI